MLMILLFYSSQKITLFLSLTILILNILALSLLTKLKLTTHCLFLTSIFATPMVPSSHRFIASQRLLGHLLILKDFTRDLQKRSYLFTCFPLL